MILGKYCKDDIIDLAFNQLGYGIIDNEIKTYNPNVVDLMYGEVLNTVNLYVPEYREDTYVPSIGTSNNGFVDIPPLFRDGRDNKPLVIIEVLPTGLSFRERNFDQVMGQVNFNSIMYTFDPSFDQMLFENLRTRRRIYGVEFKFRQDRGNPSRVYLDDINQTSMNLNVTVGFLNKWDPEARSVNNGTTVLNYVTEEPGGLMINLLAAKLKRATGRIRAKLSGGSRAAVLDAESLMTEGIEQEKVTLEAIQNAALLVGYRQE